MENAWRGTGLLPILDGTFQPNPALSTMYVPPPVATAEEAENCDPPSDEGYFYASSSEGEQISDSEVPGQQEFYEQVEVDYEDNDYTEDSPKVSSVCAVKETHQVEEKADEKLYACNSKPVDNKCSQKPRPRSPVHSIVEDMHMRIAIEASLKQAAPAPQFLPSEILQEADDEGVLEEETQLHREILQTQRWKINFLDENWQLAKKLLISAEEQPPKLKKHPYIHSMIVSPNVVPKKIQKMPMDGACFFNCIAFAMFRDVQYSRMLRDIICDSVAQWWDKPKVKVLAALVYQDKTKKQTNVRPSLVNLDPETYLQVSDMRTPTTWAGSCEIEVAAHWLHTPIRVFHIGNPRYPGNSWTCYGGEYDSYDSRTILLEWANRNHYNFIVQL